MLTARPPRKRFRTRSIVGVIVCALFLSGLPEGRSVPRPNIILVFLDDADKASVESLPNISSLIAGQGMTFERFYATQSLCCPSRASLLTGQYVHNHRVDNTNDGYEIFRARGHERRIVGRELRKAGYATGLFGKYMNGYGGSPSADRHVPPHWTRWFGALKPARMYYDYEINRNGKVLHFGNKRNDYKTFVLAKAANSWISKRAGGKPFFAYVAMTAPHGPLVKTPGHTTEYADTRSPSVTKTSFNEADVSDKPRYIRKRGSLSPREQKRIDQRYRKRMRSMLAVDDFVGDLVEKLSDAGELDETYIFVSSDNGYMQGEHRLGQKKLFPYEESVNLPLLVRGPGIAPGTTSSALASMVDLFATFADIAGGAEQRDGRSLRPLFEGTATNWRQQLLIEQMGSGYEVPRFMGVVTNQHKYVRYSTREEELYDLLADPSETTSLHATAPPALLDALKSKLDALRKCKGASCRSADGGP